jgi:hypothetical protein
MKWNEESCRSDLRSNFTDFLITCWPSALLSACPQKAKRAFPEEPETIEVPRALPSRA